MGLQLSAVTRRFVLLVPLGLRSFLVDLVPRQLGSYFALSASFLQQFVTLSVLSWM